MSNVAILKQTLTGFEIHELICTEWQRLQLKASFFFVMRTYENTVKMMNIVMLFVFHKVLVTLFAF